MKFCKKFMAQRCFGFTLIEVLIAVTLSAILFTGLTMFVTQSIQVTTRTEIALREGGGTHELFTKLETIARYPVEVVWEGTLTNGSGALVRSENEYHFIGTKTATGYCENAPSETHEFLQISSSVGLLDSEVRNSWVYSISEDGLKVYSGSTLLFWTGYRGSSIGEPLATELGGATSILDVNWSVWVADPLNNRILIYSGAVNWITALMLSDYGILAPQSLASESLNNILIGAQNWLFRIQDSVATGGTYGSTFTGVTASFSGVRVTFEGINGALTAPLNVHLDILVNGISTKNLDDPPVTYDGASVTYVYSGTTVNLVPPATLTLDIVNIDPLPDVAWQYSATVELLDASGVVYEMRSPYVVIGDGNLSTLVNNRISQVSSEPGIAGVQNWTNFKKFPWDNEEFIWSSGNTVLLGDTPIESFVWSINSGILTLQYREYQIYDCREWNHRSQDRIFKFRLL